MPISLTCLRCQDEFVHDAQGGRRPDRCPPCRQEHAREQRRIISARWRQANPERNREQQNRSNRKRLADPEHLRWKREDHDRRKYGIEPEQLRAMRDAQGDRCAICKGERCGPGDRLHIDHDHVTGQVRGLLCGRCNTLIGLAGDDPDRLRDRLRRALGLDA